jgi:hypothetical protein
VLKLGGRDDPSGEVGLAILPMQIVLSGIGVASLSLSTCQSVSSRVFNWLFLESSPFSEKVWPVEIGKLPLMRAVP